MKRSLGVLAIALSLLGCSAQASISASAGSSTKGAQTAGAEALAPRESDWDKESREEAQIAERAGTPAHESGVAESASAAGEPASTPPGKARRGKKHSRAKAKKNQDSGTEIAAASNETRSDHDRGHGNDLDGVDEDNPGKSKKK